jgi:ketosteroid isomerase-like protein
MKSISQITIFLMIVLTSCQNKQKGAEVSAISIDSTSDPGTKSPNPMKERLNLLEPESAKLLFEEMDRQQSFQPLLDLCSDSVTFKATIREGTPISGTFKGKKEVVEYFNNILPEVVSFKQLRPLEFFTNANSVVVIGDDEYTVKRDGSKHHSPYAIVLKIKNSLIEDILIIQDLSVLQEAYKHSNE